MDEKRQFLLPLQDPSRQASRLLACNQTTERYGLALSFDEALALVQRRKKILENTGRLDLSGTLPAKMALAFCDSPHIGQRDYAQTLEALLDIFYHFKNESDELASDDELLQYMVSAFNGWCQGSLDLLQGRALEAFCRRLRDEAAHIEPDDTENDESAFDAYGTFDEMGGTFET